VSAHHDPAHVVTESIAAPVGGGTWHRVAERSVTGLRFACASWTVPRGSVRYSSSNATSALSCKRCIALEPPDSGPAAPASGPITSRSPRVQYGPTIDAMIEAMPLDATRSDWLDAAVACADQAGVSPESQRRLRAALELATGGAS
jgi:hypothetical protein